jgi:hypothetical protein
MTILPFIEENSSTSPEAVIAAASTSFAHFSSLAAQDAPELRTKAPNTHIFRKDIVKCVEKYTGRRLEIKELILVNKSFCLDASTLISWEEFKGSLLKMEEIKSRNGVTRPFTNSRARLLAARKKGLLPGPGAADSSSKSGNTDVLRTSSQEIGLGHATALVTTQEQGKGARPRAALKGSDITAGGEGSSLQSYYGASLGRSF